MERFIRLFAFLFFMTERKTNPFTLFMSRLSAYEVVNYVFMSFSILCVVGISTLAMMFVAWHGDWILISLCAIVCAVDIGVSLPLIYAYFKEQRNNIKALRSYYEKKVKING